ncbi:MAG: carboxypeptidase regulatory-like domain-containing protein [Sphingomonas sp.]|uniref:TonB-dependent receptor n=2 Tax=Pseudomonadota TaxID=1224 RepID=UPI00185A6474|nr:carboxypeptidase regulatory-like domain-containing protein [Sphingomonas sp.]
MRHQLFLGVAAAALVIPAAVSAQETTSIIRGSVSKDGAPVAGAKVTAINVPTGARTEVTTGDDGEFSFPGLRIGGPYTVEVKSAQGNSSITDIYTVQQQTFNLPIELTGEEAAEVVVTASKIRNAGTASRGVQTTLTQIDISKVASVNRDIRDIQRRDPFATFDIGNSTDRGGAVRFAGVNPRFNRFTINGVTVGDTFGLNQDASPNIRGPVPFDALEQVSTSAANFDIRQTNYQGGVIDAVVRSGTNKLFLTGFYSQNTDGLSGDTIGAIRVVLPRFKAETYGATIAGPILRDRLFLMFSYERNTDPRAFGTQPESIPGLTTARIDATRAAAASARYGITGGAFGDLLRINPRLDEKFSTRVDWNVADGQRLSITYINAFNSLVSPNNTSTSATTPSYGLSSNAFTLSELLRAGIAQFNSTWSSALSTEIRFAYRSYVRGQEPLGGRGNSQFQICQDPTNTTTATGAANTSSATGCSTGTPRIFFGPDTFRQTNELRTDTYTGSFLGRLNLNNHELKLLFDFTRNSTFNNFVPNSLGSYYFDSLADFQAGNANQVNFTGVIVPGVNGAAAQFRYDQISFGIQDDWRPAPGLTVAYGFRWNLFASNDAPVFNEAFTARTGFANTQTYKGLETFEPRVSLEWRVNPALRIHGGAGILAGGNPDIYLSNSFSNTVTTNALTITRAPTNPNGCTGPSNLTPAICAAALNNIGANVNPTLAAFARGGQASALTNTAELSPNFRLPTSIRATLSAEIKFFGIDFGLDYLFSRTRNDVSFTDVRSVPIGFLPDGRRRYTGRIAFTDNNWDIVTFNTQGGRSHIGVVRFDKRFDFGLSLNGAYILQDVRDVGSASASTPNSNYRFQTFADPNFPVLGISDNQTRWQFKYGIGYDHAFYKDYKTRIQLFGETRAGNHYSFVQLDNTATRSTVFGTVLNGNAPSNLLYVPTGTNDPIVSYDSVNTQNALDALIGRTELRNFRGQIAPKNIARNRAVTRIDLHLEQEVPLFVGKSRVAVFADINNLPNLLNSNWGGVRQIGVAAVVQVQCLSQAVATGTAPGAGIVNTNSSQTCAQYRFSSFVDPAANTAANFNASTYAIRLGVRFTL